MTYKIRFLVHQDSASANSAVTFDVRLSMTRIQVVGSTAGWRIDVARFRQPLGGGTYRSWSIANPAIPTGDGLWWVTHANINQPARGEFANPPRLQGTALAEGAGSNLKYDFRGQGSASNSPWAVTATLDFLFRLDQTPEPPPEEEGDDEDVEMPEDPDPT